MTTTAVTAGVGVAVAVAAGAATMTEPARTPGAAPVLTGAGAVFCVVLTYFALQMRAGEDPAIGAGPQPKAQPRPVVVRRIIERRIVEAPPSGSGAGAPAAAGGTGGGTAASVPAAAPAASSAPAAAAPAPAPAPAPAAPVSRAS